MANIITKLEMFIKDPAFRFSILSSRGFYNYLSDREYIEKFYTIKTGKKLNLENPKTFNEKIQWLKLYDRKPIYTKMVDKYAVKDYVAEIIGDQYIIPTIGVWDDFDDIDFSKLPDQFVLKCTHDSGGLVICKSKDVFDKKAARKKIKKSLNRNYYWHGREWPYKDVRPRIIAEKYMEDKGTGSSTDHMLNVYKIFNFSGKPELIQVIQDDKTSRESIDYFDTSWNILDLKQNFPNSNQHLKKPDQLEQMLKLARCLSGDHSFLRTDFYEINGKIFFSEFTFFSDSGFAAFNPSEWDKKLGDLIVLPDEIGGGVLIKSGDTLFWVHSGANVGIGKLDDYKIHCFNGIPRMIEVDYDRFGNHRRNLYDENWNYIEAEICYPTDKSHTIDKPERLEEMLAISGMLSKGYSYMRVDLYFTGERIYFGEITLLHGSGMERIIPESFNFTLGEWIELPVKPKEYSV